MGSQSYRNPLKSLWFFKVLSQALFVSNLWFWQRFACSSFAKPSKHFLIETDDAAEEDVAEVNDYARKGWRTTPKRINFRKSSEVFNPKIYIAKFGP